VLDLPPKSANAAAMGKASCQALGYRLPVACRWRGRGLMCTQLGRDLLPDRPEGHRIDRLFQCARRTALRLFLASDLL
jgi:hypothetical protein